MKLLPSDVIDFEKCKHIDESSDSEFSYDSEASDCTYIPSEDDTFDTAYSRLSSTVPSPESFLLKPANEMKKEIKVERPASRASNTSRIQTPVTPQTRYNLRSRSSIHPINTSIAAQESPETFGRLVKQMERITKKNVRQVIETVNKSSTRSYFSSDDEQ